MHVLIQWVERWASDSASLTSSWERRCPLVLKPCSSSCFCFLLLPISPSSGVPDAEYHRANGADQFCAAICQYCGGLSGGRCGMTVDLVHSGPYHSATEKPQFQALHWTLQASSTSSHLLSLMGHCGRGSDFHY